MKIQIPEDESESDVAELIKKTERSSDLRLTWAPMSREEQEDMKTYREPEDFG